MTTSPKTTQEEESDELVKWTVRIDAELHARIKAYCAKRRMSIQHWATQALEKMLEEELARRESC